MSILDIEYAKNLRKSGEQLGRANLADRVIELIAGFDGSYVGAMALAGRMKAIAQAARFDGYWDEKVGLGFQSEMYRLIAEGKKKA